VGLVIDIYVRVSLVGIELLTIDARIVIAGSSDLSVGDGWAASAC
jgi:hypothetical protein